MQQAYKNAWILLPLVFTEKKKNPKIASVQHVEVGDWGQTDSIGSYVQPHGLLTILFISL